MLASARSWHGLWSNRRRFASHCDHHKPCQDRAGSKSATREERSIQSQMTVLFWTSLDSRTPLSFVSSPVSNRIPV